LPVPEAAARVRDVLAACLERKGYNSTELPGSAPIVDNAGARTPGAVAINRPDLRILHVVYTPQEARAVADQAKDLASRGRVVYEPTRFRTDVMRRQIGDCIGEAERASPIL
jgi:hypothetical protein